MFISTGQLGSFLWLTQICPKVSQPPIWDKHLLPLFDLETVKAVESQRAEVRDVWQASR